ALLNLWVRIQLCMLLKDYSPCFIPWLWNCSRSQGFSHGPIGPSNHWYAQVPVSEFHTVDPVQHFTHLIKCFPTDNILCASSFLLLRFVLVFYHGSGVCLC